MGYYNNLCTLVGACLFVDRFLAMKLVDNVVLNN